MRVARRIVLAAVLVAGLSSGATARAATIGMLSVRIDAEVVALREASSRVATWSVVGAAAYSGLLEQRDGSIDQYDQMLEPLAAWELVSRWPSKIDLGDGRSADVSFVCGVVEVAVGGPCFATGGLVGLGAVRIVEHDLRPGGRLSWALLFQQALCLRCRAG